MSKERTILFSAPMIRALLDGSKTQTRRIVKPQPFAGGYHDGEIYFDGFRIPRDASAAPAKFSAEAVGGGAYLNEEIYCPYGHPGDHMWVRETHRAIWGQSPGYLIGVDYKADPQENWERMRDHAGRPKWTPSIHMRREYSRIQLEIVSVRVERLNDISEADADAEGCERLDSEREVQNWKLCGRCGGTRLHRALGPNGGVVEDVDCRECDTYVKRYKHLWESINGACSWAANPWVWVVGFRRLEAGRTAAAPG